MGSTGRRRCSACWRRLRRCIERKADRCKGCEERLGDEPALPTQPARFARGEPDGPLSGLGFCRITSSLAPRRAAPASTGASREAPSQTQDFATTSRPLGARCPAARRSGGLCDLPASVGRPGAAARKAGAPWARKALGSFLPPGVLVNPGQPWSTLVNCVPPRRRWH